MSRINCNVINCSHNNERICYANVVNVGGKSAHSDSETCCASFLDSIVYSHLTNNVNDPKNSCNSITCNVATCIHNSNNVCAADSIKVSGDNVNLYTETNCLTFKNE
ncbi:DUF1540 domain-containing protein [Clostridium scatologenes]|uniref:DUF1540 domain-containing protein n=1 Tax=Clostridium scatologenes TaxID=1548 RepID=UPI00048B73DC|nr:DUF1540 domain-containing protein [Clostridium scatologenes]